MASLMGRAGGTLAVAGLSALIVGAPLSSAAASRYKQVNLVSDVPGGATGIS